MNRTRIYLRINNILVDAVGLPAIGAFCLVVVACATVALWRS